MILIPLLLFYNRFIVPCSRPFLCRVRLPSPLSLAFSSNVAGTGGGIVVVGVAGVVSVFAALGGLGSRWQLLECLSHPLLNLDSRNEC